MDGYEHPYSPTILQMQGTTAAKLPPNHDDTYREYYGMGPVNDKTYGDRPSRPQHRNRARGKHSRSQSSSSKSGSKSESRSKSRSTGSPSCSRYECQNHELKQPKPSFIDAFRVLYLTPSGHKKSTTKYLTTIKRQDRVQEILKSDGLGSKKWLFYPRSSIKSVSSTITSAAPTVPQVRESDRRIKLDGEFFRHFKKNKKVDRDSPIAKLKYWELVLYNKLGFVKAD